jgi:transposase InsO family protein
VKDFVALVGTQHKTKVRRFHTDNGGEYMSLDMTQFFKEKGILHEMTAHYAHQQNGSAERLNHTLLEKVRAMQQHACTLDSYWEFVMSTAVHVYNRTPSCHLGWRSPSEIWNGVRLDVSKLWVFGCGAYVFIPEEKHVNKLSPHSELMLFIGYASNVEARIQLISRA